MNAAQMKLRGWYENFIYRLPHDEIVAIFTNETDNKQAEEALKDSEEQLKQDFQGIRIIAMSGGGRLNPGQYLSMAKRWV